MRLTRSLLCLTALMALAACEPGLDATHATKDGATSRPGQGQGLESAFEFEPYPGSQWYGPGGDEIPRESDVVNAITGPDHCNWESTVMLHLRRPSGRATTGLLRPRQYLRDPRGLFPKSALLTGFDRDVALPPGAEYTGYRTRFMELWLDPGNRAAAFLVFADHVERWPRAKQTIACG